MKYHRITLGLVPLAGLLLTACGHTVPAYRPIPAAAASCSTLCTAHCILFMTVTINAIMRMQQSAGTDLCVLLLHGVEFFVTETPKGKVTHQKKLETIRKVCTLHGPAVQLRFTGQTV